MRFHSNQQLLLKLLVTMTAFRVTTPFSFRSPKPIIKIEVCQNKDCCRKWKTTVSLDETLRDLIPPEQQQSGSTAAAVRIEVTGCLSQCDKGPNVQVKKHKEDFLINGLADATSAAVLLEEIADVSVPSKLLAAVNVMEKAQKATSADERDKLLSSVIKALNADSALKLSSANARAHFLRASLYHNEYAYEAAHKDAVWALAVPGISPDFEARVWRLKADVCKDLGRLDEAVAALQQAAMVNPQFTAKLSKEIQVLRSSTA